MLYPNCLSILPLLPNFIFNNKDNFIFNNQKMCLFAYIPSTRIWWTFLSILELNTLFEETIPNSLLSSGLSKSLILPFFPDSTIHGTHSWLWIHHAIMLDCNYLFAWLAPILNPEPLEQDRLRGLWKWRFLSLTPHFLNQDCWVQNLKSWISK